MRDAIAVTQPGGPGTTQRNTSYVGLLLLFGWSVALFFHLYSGLRHLIWDAGFTPVERDTRYQVVREYGPPPSLAEVERVLAVARGDARATELSGGRAVRRSARLLVLSVR